MQMWNVLVCGGAGYIGSHMSQWLAEQGHAVTVLDNLSTGHWQAVKWGELIQADLLDESSLERAFSGRRYDVVMHFAASSLVASSVADPFSTYRNNVAGTLNLLAQLRYRDIGKVVFSSTAAVFGPSSASLVDEQQPMQPINPYGASKLMVERMLADAWEAYGLSSVVLRYFNAAGALPEHGIGEAHACETHLIPNVLRAAAGQAPPLKVFGADYPTPDGTCVRDYVHVQDLARAHGLAMNLMERSPGTHDFNLGSEQGYSVMDIVEAAAQVVGRAVPFEVVGRRAGDPARLVASSAKAQRELGWERSWQDLVAIIKSAWDWHREQPF
ncbi:UDP-glucose 4-epimerase GalE [Stenotrophomonas maltophilia]|uniref:UDP-glucose 4-epimerase GalE n=2 Tax=Stenotrophomonas maltophilia TaxID=40324 RepID=UPI000B4E7C38|nr:UDP-glucose 4-epimerase GalE [Stenotrophomonas maltophilia]MPS43168.1 UDP-glucose 4-epimerase GalE [Stenotrophomonas sp.]MBA0385698.1 UDP-glucose 4-epimerase GalE [Stenotrophomonas maltophilia]OWQ81878.1 UDP-glucose 4-epimerase GalE [Stenotrophomonas maltophilia]PJK96679.1 UDP-glucose 4-epimerase GalE [Stenotrophomonas maltophilia]QPX95331.1 UDP-glucose 4-epimerase GalE [Stenotrophomonas maltophilia]